ncbi:MAG TPA: cytochrome d ubiquinol oxidase subunit II [Thermoleophilaceae bacterium]
MAETCLILALATLTAYVVLGGADFGGGFWDLTAGGAQRGGPLRGLLERSITPVWEANHVWLPFLLVVLWTAFPRFFGSVTSTLYIPLFGATAGIILRGTAFVLRPHATSLGQARLFGAGFAVSSVLVPFCFGAAIGGIASGRVPVGNAGGDPWSSWLNPTSITVGVLAVITGAYLAAIFLAGDAERAGEPELERATRRRALISGVVAGAVALGALAVVRSDARELYDGLTSGAGLALVIASAILGIATLVLVWTERLTVARFTAAAAVACVIAGWAAAQSPYLLPGELTLDQAAASNATLVALVIAAGAGLALVLPSLFLLYRLVLRGRLDQPYQPLDMRWRS